MIQCEDYVHPQSPKSIHLDGLKNQGGTNRSVISRLDKRIDGRTFSVGQRPVVIEDQSDGTDMRPSVRDRVRSRAEISLSP